MNGQLPDTQTLEDVEYSQDIEEPIWGMLYAVKRRFKTLAMRKSEYSVGRLPSCDIVLEKEKLVFGNEISVTPEAIQDFERFHVSVPETLLSTFSKLHFKIKKHASVVVLEDYSSNGTYVNGSLIGKNNKVVLQTNDQLSLSHNDYTAYVFMETTGYSNRLEQLKYPSEVKDNYVVSCCLGNGAFGEVMLVFQKRTSESFAMKVVKKKSLNPARDTINNEVTILRTLSHPCVINTHNVIDSSDKVFIFLDYMEGGDLFQKVKSRGKLTESLTKWFFYQISKAVAYLHRQGIAHRDLKPENILLSSDKDCAIVKITDFGLSRFFNSQMVMQTVCGTPLYVAPEILETKGCGAYSNQVDVWSMGVILYICLSGGLPFSVDRKDLTLQEQVCSGAYSFPTRNWRGVTEKAVDLVKRMMTVNPKTRIMANMIFSQPWFQDAKLEKDLEASKLFCDEYDENEPPSRRPKLDYE